MGLNGRTLHRAVGAESTTVTVGGKKEENFTPPSRSIPDSTKHIREFLDGIKSRKEASCNFEYGFKVTKGGLPGNVAFRSGERFKWDDQRERIMGPTKAAHLLTRKYRKPCRLAGLG